MCNRRLNLLLPIIVFAIALPLLPGCSSRQHSETTTTTTEPTTAASSSQTTTTTTTDDDSHDSVLGATAHLVWTVIAFPFRVVGDVLGEIV
jgi:uncharacterized lipoprotein YajG